MRRRRRFRTTPCPGRPAACSTRRRYTLQAQAPIGRGRLWDGSTPWLVTRYEDQRALLADPRISADSNRPPYRHVGAGQKERRQESRTFLDGRSGARPVAPDGHRGLFHQAPGVAPRRLPDSDLAGVHVLRTLDDSLALRAALLTGPRVVVVGAGFLGAEVAAAARTMGLDSLRARRRRRGRPALRDEGYKVTRRGTAAHSGATRAHPRTVTGQCCRGGPRRAAPSMSAMSRWRRSACAKSGTSRVSLARSSASAAYTAATLRAGPARTAARSASGYVGTVKGLTSVAVPLPPERVSSVLWMMPSADGLVSRRSPEVPLISQRRPPARECPPR
ncbi:FAD-dependent oxidoreductase [Streptomyces sp. NPDC002676]